MRRCGARHYAHLTEEFLGLSFTLHLKTRGGRFELPGYELTVGSKVGGVLGAGVDTRT